MKRKTLIDVEASKNGLVKRIIATKRLRQFDFRVDGHEEVAKRVVDDGLMTASIIVSTRHLSEELLDDQRHVHRTNELWPSEVEDEARKRIGNDYLSIGDVEELKKKHELHDWKDNFTSGAKKREQDIEFSGQLLDSIFDSQVKALYPEIMEEMKAECLYVYDEDNDKERKLSKKQHDAAWSKRKAEILLPRVHTWFARVYRMPEPLKHWDDRNRWQQWYLVGTDKGMDWTVGGSAGSGQREEHGKMGHAFALLESQGQAIPTWMMLYDERNRLNLVNRYETFKVMRNDLTGNYQADWQKTKKLFKGRLLELDYETGALIDDIGD